MLLKPGRFLRKFFSEGLLRMKNSKRKENLLLKKSKKINEGGRGRGDEEPMLEHVFYLYFFSFFVCFLLTYTHALEFLSVDLFHPLFSRFQTAVCGGGSQSLKWVRCLKFFFIFFYFGFHFQDFVVAYLTFLLVVFFFSKPKINSKFFQSTQRCCWQQGC